MDAQSPNAGVEAPALERIGRYAVLYPIGRGGVGSVYAARDEMLERTVAIKLISDVEARPSTSSTDRLIREARALAKLSHPNVVQVHEVGSEAGTTFIVMEHVEGRTLSAWIREQAPSASWTEVVEVLLGVARGLAAAHAVGIVHGDIKPDNLMVDPDGRARVVDFGLARDPGESSLASGSEVGGTRATGSSTGTLAYMAPEQLRDEPSSPAADQFSLAVIAFEAVHGHRPFAGDDPSALLAAITRQALESGTRTKLPAGLRRVIERGLAAIPEDRWPSMAAFAEALAHELERPRRKGRPEGVPKALANLIEIATRTSSRQEFRTEALAWVDRHVGFDTALFGRPEASGADAPMVRDFDMAFVQQFAARPERYAPTLMKVVGAALGRAAPVRDTDVYSLSERSKTPFYNELIGPKGSKVMMISALTLGGAMRGSLQISRASRGTSFSDAELTLIEQALPMLALGEGVQVPSAPVRATPPVPRSDGPRLTARELEVLDYLGLGLTNAEIALACGTSINTVRSQVAALLRKVGAASRTELVAIALREGILSSDR